MCGVPAIEIIYARCTSRVEVVTWLQRSGGSSEAFLLGYYRLKGGRFVEDDPDTSAPDILVLSGAIPKTLANQPPDIDGTWFNLRWGLSPIYLPSPSSSCTDPTVEGLGDWVHGNQHPFPPLEEVQQIGG